MEKNFARTVSTIFHPLAMTTIGVLIMFNSGTSLSVVQGTIKNLTLITVLLFTVLFPALTVLLLYYTKVISGISLSNRKERTLPIILTIILYVFTFFVLKNINQLTRGHVVFMFCPPVALFAALIINNFLKLSIHMLALGGLIGMILILIFLYGADIQLMFLLAVLAAGMSGTSRLILNVNSPMELLVGFSTGFVLTIGIMLLFLV